ncbi:722_t:CDS:2, partial [Gigaspora rosea]
QIIKVVWDFKFISFDEEERLFTFYYGEDDLDKLDIDIRDPYNLQHVIENETISNLCKEFLNNEALTKLDISSEEFNPLMDESIYYTLDGCLWVQKISKKQWIEYLQKRSQGFDKIRVLPKKSQIEKILQKLISGGSLVKWEVNGEENAIWIQAFKKSDSNT